jgi:predicted ATP-grasp superfamily ATP-dependent carboligase
MEVLLFFICGVGFDFDKQICEQWCNRSGNKPDVSKARVTTENKEKAYSEVLPMAKPSGIKPAPGHKFTG